ncbi:PREDICTED: uncharacterized protein LOC104604674 isoform X3 [Nelumbo nucifera]|uniref:Uncharacterized protein LOC104604674 isoform X3 n=1 Tax=Nelumbo nucifera TaxID=4432 RepID=A0A1U8AJL0_NELNU|nr:PREDICTED: uncharacterized protein LOC104604674 isoform X3 [Nelumbo nucifera]
MEAAAGVAAGRGSSLSMPSSQSARKEWRAVSDHHSVRNVANEELERSKMGQSDERTIYEVQQGTGPLDVDFCSITVDGSLDNDILQKRLHGVSRQREQLQQMEIELRAQLIARSEITEVQTSFDARIKEHTNVAAKLKDQLQEREQTIHELQMKLEEKDRELQAIKIDNEAAWAKEDLLREQNKELATFRRERDNSEAERVQHLKQIHDLKEHIEQKERQFFELEEQHRVAQETILYKDEQIREANAWIARVQEMDALQSTTNHSLQAELQERTEQFNQFWLGCQRQFAEMERLHLHTIQQLQLELAEAREKSGVYKDESHITHANSKDVSQFGQKKGGNQLNVIEGGTANGNCSGLPNGNVENFPPFVTSGNASTKTDHAPGVPVVQSSMIGMGAYFPPGQVTALHPFVMHQQGVPHSMSAVSSHVPQSQVGHFQPITAISSQQHWQNQQTVSEGSQVSNQNQHQPSETDQNLLRSDGHYDYELSTDGQVLPPDYLDAHISQNREPGSLVNTPTEEEQVVESNDRGYLVSRQPHQNLQDGSSQIHDSLRLNHHEEKSQGQDESIVSSVNHPKEGQSLSIEQPWNLVKASVSDIPTYPVDSSEALNCTVSGVVEGSTSAGQTTNLLTPAKVPEHTLLDERSLLACIVRAIPAGSGGRIRISSTLPNRLGKMLAPLHWHDYKKKYGKLDDFVAGHPELFVIQGDFIQLREGAQEIISATAAVAKVAAAASAPYSSLMPSVAVTPMAQSNRLKKAPSIDTKSVISVSTEHSNTTRTDVSNKSSQFPVVENQHLNGVSLDIVQGLSNVTVLSKPRDVSESNGLQSEVIHGNSSVNMSVGNGSNPDKTVLGAIQSKVSSNGRHGMYFGGKQQARTSGAASTSRR